MAQDSKIQWTEQTWNPVSGCTKISTGCKNCYAETIANRFWKDRKFTDVQTHSHKLIEPIKRKKPTTYFVNSMSDLFHEDVPFEFIDQVFAVVASTPQHTYQVLTKRPERMLEYFQRLLNGTSDPNPDIWDEARKPIWSATKGHAREYIGVMSAYVKFPLKNVWLGVSAEDQDQANNRGSILFQVPAKVRFFSLEPLLGSIDLTLVPDAITTINQGVYSQSSDSWLGHEWTFAFDWVIIGGESGQNARPCHLTWIRSLVQQCKDANTACFVKQLGSNFRSVNPESETVCPPLVRWQFCDTKGGDITEWPSDLQVRQFPNP